VPGACADLPENLEFDRLCDSLRAADFNTLGNRALGGDAGPLDDALASLLASCRAISDSLTAHYFTHVLLRAS
jgi:hypothetical protein